MDPARVITETDVVRDYSYDAWPSATKWRQQGKAPYPPDGVVYPVNEAEVAAIVRWATERRVPLTPRGGGSSVTGAPIPTNRGLVIDMTRMNRTVWLEETDLLVHVEAGKNGGVLEAELNSAGYTLNHIPQSLSRSTVGGWIATRASGQLSTKWGGIERLIAGITAVLGTGEMVTRRPLPRRAVGPEGLDLLLGSEGALAIITSAVLRVFPRPDYVAAEAFILPSLEAGLHALRLVLRAGVRPSVARLYDQAEGARIVADLAPNESVLLLTFDGEEGPADAEMKVARRLCSEQGARELGRAPVDRWLKNRFSFAAIESALATPGGFADTIEVANRWSRIRDTYRDLRSAVAPYAESVWGHFSHAYTDGVSLYVIVLGKAATAADAESALEKVGRAAMSACARTGAAISHHHGTGLARTSFVEAELGSEFPVRRRIKDVFDPAGILNPSKLGL